MKKVMLIAGEASGDLLAAELVTELRNLAPATDFFGAGGSHMAAAGVELHCDMTQHAVIGLWEAVRKYFDFRKLLNELLRLAIELRPDVIVCVDFGGFNSRFAAALQDYRHNFLTHTGWSPRLVQFVSPQVWASRPGRANTLARDFDKLLCILPFEKDWWAERVPQFPVEFVGHPIVGRHRSSSPDRRDPGPGPLVVALMPGSRRGELKKHLPLITAAAIRIAAAVAVEFRMLLPTEEAQNLARPHVASIPNCTIQVGDPAGVLGEAAVALSKTGTITLECALFGVPTITFYQTSPLTYLIGRRLVTVPYLSMPNLLASDPVFPEFVQDDATPESLANAVLALLKNPADRSERQRVLKEVVSTLGQPGAAKRAAQAIVNLSET
jgi:lipid-A-disaccharide synthase